MDENKWKYITYVIAFCVVLTGVGCFWLGTYFADDTKVEVTCNCIDDTVDATALSKEEAEQIGYELYELSISNTDVSNIIYGNKNYAGLNNTDRLEVAMNLISDNAFIEQTDEYIQVYKALFDDAYHKMFGSDKTINYEDFSYNNMSCSLVNNFIECNLSIDSTTSNLLNNFSYSYTEEDESGLYVYVNYLGAYYRDDDLEIYSDIDMTKLIDTFSYETGIDYFSNYEDQAGTYKLTYELDDDGNYYWVSTEAI